MTTLTQEKADELDRSVGAIPIGKYVKSSIKREYQCVQCGNLYLCTSSHVKIYRQIYCQKCSPGKRRGENHRHNIEHVKQICIAKGFEPLFDEYNDSGSKIKVRCNCGNIFDITLDQITRKGSRRRTSCGHCRDPQLGVKYGKLTPIIIFSQKLGGGCQVICECECGRDTHMLFGSQIINGGIKSCGQCSLNRNGRATSHIALQLHDMIEKILGQKCEHNFHIKGLGCIDICQPELKIVVEYDGYYWHRVHKDQTIRDKDKIKKLVKSGWKVLHIKSGGRDIPSEKQLRKVLLNCFQHNIKKRTITMKSWKNAEKKFNGTV
jgi:very-short-patch-repair endonuclease